MLHNQNHLSSPTNQCNKNGECIYGFPHAQQQMTTIDDFGHIHWRRRHAEDATAQRFFYLLTVTFTSMSSLHPEFSAIYTNTSSKDQMSHSSQLQMNPLSRAPFHPSMK